MIQGILKATGVAIGAITINLKGVTAKIEAEFFLLNPETGSTVAGGSMTSWSPETMEAVRTLRSLMERDAGRLLFETEASTSKTVDAASSVAREPTGIGELLRRNPDTSSV